MTRTRVLTEGGGSHAWHEEGLVCRDVTRANAYFEKVPLDTRRRRGGKNGSRDSNEDVRTIVQARDGAGLGSDKG